METTGVDSPAKQLMRTALILPYEGRSPAIDATAFLAPGVVVAGDVRIGPEVGVWFNTVIRGDVDAVHIGARTNIQDNSVLHVTGGRVPLRIGAGVTVGHRVVLHGCTVMDDCLIGMGAIVLDEAVIEPGSLVAAGALVPEGMIVRSGSLVAGVPARVRRQLSDAEVEGIRRSAEHYVQYARAYQSSTQEP